jgi:hypothetical protein
MAVTHRIARYDIVELTEPVDEAPAGERGGVLELYDDGTAMVELTSLPAQLGVDRIVVAPVSKLRVIDARPQHSR